MVDENKASPSEHLGSPSAASVQDDLNGDMMKVGESMSFRGFLFIVKI